MATESLPESASISLENWIQSLGTVVAQSTQESLYPSSNLTLFDRTERWWTTNANFDAWATVDLGSAKLPTFLALIDSNVDAGEDIVLKGADDSGITTNVLTWTFTTWAQSAIGKMLRWYMGDPDIGSAAARRYWRILIPGNGTSDAQHRLGGLWLGEHDDFLIEPGARFRPVAPPRRAGRFLVQREIGLDVSSRMDWEDFYALQEKLQLMAVSQQKHVVLDLHGSAATDELRKNAAHYGIIEGVDGALNHASNSDLGFEFGEVNEDQLAG